MGRMSNESFRELYEGFCNAAGLPAPELLQDDGLGITAFHVQVRGVTVNVVHARDLHHGQLLVQAECGLIASSDAAAVMQSMLEANFFRMHERPFMFSRNPFSGEVALECMYPFAALDGAGLLELIEEGVELATRWRHGTFPQASQAACAAPLSIHDLA